jgi:hypothetical protein
MVPKIMLEGGHAWVHERPIAAAAAPPYSLVLLGGQERGSAICKIAQQQPGSQHPAGWTTEPAHDDEGPQRLRG